MSGEAIAPTTCGSYLYEGYYRPRGGLSFAERAAWGLRSVSDSKPAAIDMPHARKAAGEWMKHAKPAGAAGPLSGSRQPQTPVRAGDAVRRHVRILALADHAAYRRPAAASKRIAARGSVTVKWRRFRLRSNGRSMSCISIGKRVFVTGGFVREGTSA
jgi:hypothetical protein